MLWGGWRCAALLLSGLEELAYLAKKLCHAAVSLLQALELFKEAQRCFPVVLSSAARVHTSDLRLRDMDMCLSWLTVDRVLPSTEAAEAVMLAEERQLPINRRR